VCDRCSQIDERILHYHELAKLVLDKGVLESIAQLIANLEAEKRILHPTPEN
jgi:hypothetical protein